MYDDQLIYNTLIYVLCMKHIDVAFYYLRKKIKQYPNLEQRKVTTVDTFFSTKIAAMWKVYKGAPEKFEWGTCETLLKIMLGLSIQCGSSWFDVNTLLIPMNLGSLQHWILVKLELTDWTIEVYDSMEHEGPHNQKVREGVQCLSMFIPMLADQISLFQHKPREPHGIHPIPVTIMKDIPQQGNGLVQLLQMFSLFNVACDAYVNFVIFHSCNRGDCGMFTIKNAECLIEGRDVRYWVIPERLVMFREWLTCYLWAHARRKLAGEYKSDEDKDID